MFNQDTARLLTMRDMWRFRTPPIPLQRDEILKGSFGAVVSNGLRDHKRQGFQDDDLSGSMAMGRAQLNDQKTLGLREHVKLFDSR